MSRKITDDVRTFFDEKDYVFAFDLDGRDVTDMIAKVEPGKVGFGKTAKSCPIITFMGQDKKFAMNVTNVKTMAELYGTHLASKWVGKKITMYPTTTNFGGKTVDCIRIRNVIPGHMEEK